MTANGKIELEKFIINNTTLESGKRYFLAGTDKVYVHFEGQTIVSSDYYVSMRIAPVDKRILTTGCKYHTGFLTFYSYAKTQLGVDKIIDALAEMLDEQSIQGTTARVDLEAVYAYQRNKFEGSNYYENIGRVNYRQWE